MCCTTFVQIRWRGTHSKAADFLDATFRNPTPELARNSICPSHYEIRRFAGYGQIATTLLDPDGLFARNRDGVNVVLTRPEDLASGSPEQATAQLDQLLGVLEQFTSGSSGGISRWLLSSS